MKAVKLLLLTILTTFSVNAFSQSTTGRMHYEKVSIQASEQLPKNVDSAYLITNETEKYVSQGHIIAELFNKSLIVSDKDIKTNNFLIQRSSTIHLQFQNINQ